jgi:glycosyltransferase involved in cell wall biosynthesis
MRAGLCCVASDLPGSRELLGPISSRAVASSTSDLRNLLGVLTASPTAIDELGALARERYENQFTAAAMVARIEVVYRSVTARTSQQS